MSSSGVLRVRNAQLSSYNQEIEREREPDAGVRYRTILVVTQGWARERERELCLLRVSSWLCLGSVNCGVIAPYRSPCLHYIPERNGSTSYVILGFP